MKVFASLCTAAIALAFALEAQALVLPPRAAHEPHGGNLNRRYSGAGGGDGGGGAHATGINVGTNGVNAGVGNDEGLGDAGGLDSLGGGGFDPLGELASMLGLGEGAGEGGAEAVPATEEETTTTAPVTEIDD
ncbi:MAG: hypothetical protein M1838_001184 [Thelocarpon superellum]|nr:MAG: hypothetical protein M1838_001184 [Thelocarpon superellum]